MSHRPAHPRPPAFDASHFRRALGQFATGVTVITTRTEEGRFLGLTANSFNSVSLDPPLVLWSLANSASALAQFSGNTHYIVNVLAAGQAPLAEHFAKRQQTNFDSVPYRLSESGLPILEGTTAWFECHNRSRYPEGDHTIFVGEVESCNFAAQSALVFHDGRFSSTSTSHPV